MQLHSHCAMPKLSRRTLFFCGLAAAQLALTGCGGGLSSKADAREESPTAGGRTPAVPTEAAAAWNIWQALAFVAGTPSTIDLNNTLPAGVATGGAFGVANTGSPLPATIQLAANGVLSISATAVVGAISGVVFTYAEPQR